MGAFDSKVALPPAIPASYTRAAASQSSAPSGERRICSSANRAVLRSLPALLIVGLDELRYVDVGLALAVSDVLATGSFSADANRRLLLLGLDDRQALLALVIALGRVDHDGCARHQLLAQHEVCKRILDVALDRAAQRPCAHCRIPALVDEQILGRLGQLQL